MGSCDFCFNCSGRMGDRFLSLSLMLFGGRIGDFMLLLFNHDTYKTIHGNIVNNDIRMNTLL